MATQIQVATAREFTAAAKAVAGNAREAVRGMDAAAGASTEDLRRPPRHSRRLPVGSASYFLRGARRCLTASKSATPVATDTLRLSTAPAIGIETS